MGQIIGGALFGKALVNEGVEKAFVLCGGHIMPILYGMRQAGIEITDVRHEASAMYAAIAYTRATGKPAVAVTTAGPGVVNTTPGMIEALELGVPVLHIGGAVVVNGRDAGPLQDMSTLNVMEVCSKWARKITSAARIPEYISLALRQATDLTPGPVYLEVPADLPLVRMEESEIKWPVKPRTDSIPFGDPTQVDAAAELLANAERPAALVGDGARFSIGERAADVAALSDYLKMPVAVASSACRGLFGDEMKHPLLKTYGLLGADVVLTMGCRFDYRLGMGQGIGADTKVIQVHTDMRQIGFNLRADIGIVGGTGPVASQLLAAVKGKRPEPAESSWLGDSPMSGPAALPNEYRAEGIPIHPARCAGEVAKFLAEEGRDWNLVVDGGEAGVWMSIAVTATRPGQIYGGSAIGMIGTGPANTIGAWVTNRKPILWYTGDGSFGFYAMEMDTMARLGIPVVCVISNDSAWGMIRLEQKYTWEKEVEERGQCNTELSIMRAYEKMTAMWDGYGEVVTDPEEIVPAIKRAAANGKPSIINVEVDHESLSPFIASVKQWRNVYYLQD
jgi:thiamine pyrophosphate-dependent acetolactate synthase large subunit-like protein